MSVRSQRMVMVLVGLILALVSVHAAGAEDWNICNGGFADGGETPAQWTKEGQVRLARDTAVFKQNPAALRVQCDGGSGNACQWVELRGARTFTVKGHIKAAGGAKAQAVVQCIDDKWSKNEWKQLKYLAGDSDWQAFDKEVSLPDWTARFRVMLHVEGKGQAWLDEVTIGNQPVRAARALDPAKDEPLDGKPWEPAWCIWGWRSAWVGMHQGFVDTTKKGGIDVIFYGDSITMGWKDRWQEPLAPLKVVNYGIGGDSTRQLLWRIGHGEVDGLKPKLVVLGIGTNNLYGDKNAGTDDEIARGIEAVAKLLREKLPDAKILLVGLLPRQNDFFCNRIRKLNTQIGKLADGKTIRFITIWEPLMKAEPGTVNDDLFVEKGTQALHPNDKGYQVMMDAMKPVILEMVK